MKALITILLSMSVAGAATPNESSTTVIVIGPANVDGFCLNPASGADVVYIGAKKIVIEPGQKWSRKFHPKPDEVYGTLLTKNEHCLPCDESKEPASFYFWTDPDLQEVYVEPVVERATGMELNLNHSGLETWAKEAHAHHFADVVLRLDGQRIEMSWADFVARVMPAKVAQQ